MRWYFIFMLILVSVWILFTYYLYVSLHNLNNEWNKSDDNKLSIIEAFEAFDRCLIALFVVNAISLMFFAHILNIYASNTDPEHSSLDSFLDNKFVFIFLIGLVLLKALTFFYMWSSRRNSIPGDSQFTKKQAYNTCFYIFAFCGLVLIPVFLGIAYKIQSPKSQTIESKRETDFVSTIIERKKSIAKTKPSN